MKTQIFFMLLIVFNVISCTENITVEENTRTQTTVITTDKSPNVVYKQKYALVIGNANYQTITPLKNTIYDAKDIANALTSMGFNVTLLTDTKDQRAMEDAVYTFSQKLQQAEVALFYYSGHGIQLKGENYLIPIQAKIREERDIKYETMPMQYVMEAIDESPTQINIFILDACRDNPYASQFTKTRSSNISKGLARVKTTPSGAIIMFATAPGETAEDGIGQNGTYTKALLEHITTPGIDIHEMNRRVLKTVYDRTSGQQEPWVEASLREKFCFHSCDNLALLKKEKDILKQQLEQVQQQLLVLQDTNRSTSSDSEQAKILAAKFTKEKQALLLKLQQLEEKNAELLARIKILNQQSKTASNQVLNQELEQLKLENQNLKEKISKLDEQRFIHGFEIDVFTGF